MKYQKLFLFAALFLTSCTVSVSTPFPTNTPVATTSVSEIIGTPTMTVTPDPAMGNIEGDLLWLLSSTSTNIPISGVNLEINGHTVIARGYATRVDQNGHFKFANIEPAEYGFGVYLNLQLSERQCEAPEYIYGKDLGWQHYATWLKVEVFYDILFSSTDVVVRPGETVVLDFVLKCP